MTFSNDGRCVVEKRTYSEDEIEAKIHKSREECKRLRKLGQGNDRCSPPSEGSETPPSKR